MANTIIQIKRSSVTGTPTGGSLSVAEQAYSYNSNKLFIGDAAGTGVIAIGGKFFVDQQNTIYDLANAAYNAANSAGSLAVINLIFDTANAAYTKANSANVLAYNTGIGANNYAGAMANAANAYTVTVGTSGNAYAAAAAVSANNYAGAMANAANASAAATYVKLTSGTSQTISSDIAISGNLTIAGVTTYANSQTLLIGDNLITLNADIPSTVAPAENAGIEVNRGNKNSNASLLFIESTSRWAFTSNNLLAITTYIASNTDLEVGLAAGNAYAVTVGTSGNAYAVAVGAAGNAYANVVGTAGNTYASAVGTSANAYATASTTAANNYAGAMANSVNSAFATADSGVRAYVNTSTTAANTYAATVGTSANAYAVTVGAAANTNAANGSYISTGIVKVPYGGTGLTTFTQNGIVFGNTAGDLKVTAAGTEGQVLQATVTGVPQFGMLDGGTF